MLGWLRRHYGGHSKLVLGIFSSQKRMVLMIVWQLRSFTPLKRIFRHLWQISYLLVVWVVIVFLVIIVSWMGMKWMLRIRLILLLEVVVRVLVVILMNYHACEELASVQTVQKARNTGEFIWLCVAWVERPGVLKRHKNHYCYFYVYINMFCSSAK